jgi:hypothetical protein
VLALRTGLINSPAVSKLRKKQISGVPYKS